MPQQQPIDAMPGQTEQPLRIIQRMHDPELCDISAAVSLNFADQPDLHCLFYRASDGQIAIRRVSSGPDGSLTAVATDQRAIAPGLTGLMPTLVAGATLLLARGPNQALLGYQLAYDGTLIRVYELALPERWGEGADYCCATGRHLISYTNNVVRAYPLGFDPGAGGPLLDSDCTMLSLGGIAQLLPLPLSQVHDYLLAYMRGGMVAVLRVDLLVKRIWLAPLTLHYRWQPITGLGTLLTYWQRGLRILGCRTSCMGGTLITAGAALHAGLVDLQQDQPLRWSHEHCLLSGPLRPSQPHILSYRPVGSGGLLEVGVPLRAEAPEQGGSRVPAILRFA